MYSGIILIITSCIQMIWSVEPPVKTKYDLDTVDVSQLCPKIDGFEYTLSGSSDKRKNSLGSGVCYKYYWVSDPCTPEKSGRSESDMLHCGHYEMKPCEGTEVYTKIPDGFDLNWTEMQGLCDNVIDMKGVTTVRLPNLPCVYWKWNYCASGNGPESRPCGRYSVVSCSEDPLMTPM